VDWEWSDQVDQADWIAARQPAGAQVCTMPSGFPACVRLLHPIDAEASGDAESANQIRWAQVAQWSRATLDGSTRFWQLALPETRPPEAMPGDGAPASDVLGPRDGRALVEILRAHTGTPDRCWFGLWNGYGCFDPRTTARSDAPAQHQAEPANQPPRPGLAPAAGGPSSPGPLVRLPGRDYLLYTGPVEAALAFLPEHRELADLAWPHDRAWFVFGDVDLNSTYVAGSTDLAEALLASDDLEAVAVDPKDPGTTGLGDLPDWLAHRIDETVSTLRATHHAELRTSRFTVSFELGSLYQGSWRLHFRSDNPSQGGGYTTIPDDGLAAHLRNMIITTIVDLIG
jgi:hypothetical protein